MTANERRFLNDVKNEVEEWGYSYEFYHENGNFCVDVTIGDMDEWADFSDEIWNALEDVCDDWDAELDSDTNSYYLCLN